MGRSPCCEKVGLKKGPWTSEEDQKLVSYVEAHGHGSWRALPAKAGLQRCGKSCRLRWTNYLRPDIKRGKFSLQEEQTIIQLHALLGNRWSVIATHLFKRTDNEIKNYWNTHLKKRLTKMGIDPITHKPKSDALGSGYVKDFVNLSHMTQWESARLEAESRLVRESNPMQIRPNPVPHRPFSTLSAHRATPFPSTLPCLDVLKSWQEAWLKPNTFSPTTCFNFSGDNLESPTSTLSFSDHSVPIPDMGSSGALGLQGLASYPMTEVAWEDSHDDDDIMQDMFGFGGLDQQGSAMLDYAGHNNDNEEEMVNANVSHGVELEDNKNYWDGILNMVSASPSGS